MAKIIAVAKQQTLVTTLMPSWKMELPTSSYIQIYPRVSTPEQKKNVSAEMQVDRGFALACGWPEELIILDDRDLGVSGQLRMEDRFAFNGMNHNIANGVVKIVLAAQVDRLFRDRWGAEYAKFMEICYTYGVKVMTLNHTRTAIDFIYDFSISWHVDQFRRKCEEAWKYIESHVYRMLGAKEEAAKSGRWTGQNMPIGYMPDFRERVDGKKNPKYKHWMIYPPHLEKLDWLYKRYKQLGGSLYDLFREVHRQKDFFPAFEAWVPDVVLTHCKMLMALFDDQEEVDIEQLRTTGFTVQSAKGLASILRNPFNAGILVYKGVLINAEDHDPATSLGNFLYAFNRLSPSTLDGTPNPYYEEKKKVYAKRFQSKVVAALYGKLEAADARYRVYPRVVPTRSTKRRKAEPGPEDVRKYYGFYDTADPLGHASYLIPVSELDGCFFKHFVTRLQHADNFENFLEYETQELQEREKTLARIERDIIADKAAMERIKAQVRNGELTNAELAKEANNSYSALEQDVARLERGRKALVSATSTRQRRIAYKELMKRAGDRWQEIVVPEDLPEMVDTFVEKVVWERVAPHFYTLTVYWRDPEWGVECLLCFREIKPSVRWSTEEEALLRENYQTATADELLSLLPGRSTLAITKRATILKLTNGMHKDWAGYTTNPQLRASRWEKTWTPEEDAILREKYPKATAEELLQSLPGRTRGSIERRVGRLGVATEVKRSWKQVGRHSESILTDADREIMTLYTITEEELRVPGVKLLRCSGVHSDVDNELMQGALDTPDAKLCTSSRVRGLELVGTGGVGPGRY